MLFLPRLTFAAHARHARVMMFLLASFTMIGLGSGWYGASMALIVFTISGWSFAHGLWWHKKDFELIQYLAMMALAGMTGTLLPLLLFVAISDKLPTFNANIFLLACALLALQVISAIIGGYLFGTGVRLLRHYSNR